MPRSRYGVAVLLPEPWCSEVNGLRRALGDGNRERIPPHVTLVPPVNVRDDRVAEAVDVIRRAAAGTRPFTVVVGAAASFLPDNAVVYLSVGGDVEALEALRSRVFVPPLERPLGWPFVPHVTLADDVPPERTAAALEALRSYESAIAVDRVHLLREEGEGPARRWVAAGDFPFGAAAVVGRGGLPLELAHAERPDPLAAGFLEREWRRFDEERYGAGTIPRPLAVTARRDGSVVGVAAGKTVEEHARLDDLLVAAGARRQGVGSHLLAAFASAAAARGCSELRVRAEASSPGVDFYRARGFRAEVVIPKNAFGRDFVQLRRAL